MAFKYFSRIFLDRNINMPKMNESQALVLEGTNILDNSIGTARGIHYKKSKGNTMLLKLSNNKYVFIGGNIYEFNTNDIIR